MSDYRAIAGVSNSLKNLLSDRMEKKAQVTIAPPDVELQGLSSGGRLNLYLYQISENAGLKNQEIPGDGHPGVYGHPPLSLDLHYLLTAYGGNETVPDADVTAQEILGDAMRVLHDCSIITPTQMQKPVPGVATPPGPILDPSLRDDFERIKITLQTMNLEELSKLWTALPKANFRRSVAYEVSVIQIESRRQKRSAPPVLDLPRTVAPRVFVVPFEYPHIAEISPIQAEIGETLTIRGINLGRAVQVRIGDLTLPVSPFSDTWLEVVIPQDTYPDGAAIEEKDMLHAGPHTVQVVTDVPELSGKHFVSNLAAFMLIPVIEHVSQPTANAGDTLTITAKPNYFESDRAWLFVGDRGLEIEPLPSIAKSRKTALLRFKLPTAKDESIPPRTDPYPLRLRINGAESRYVLMGTPPQPKWTLKVHP